MLVLSVLLCVAIAAKPFKLFGVGLSKTGGRSLLMLSVVSLTDFDE